jgi:pimeloyl-ACP methyl ester carboxylesterase
MTVLNTKGADAHVTISHGSLRLSGELNVPHSAVGLAVFAHGSGSSRHSPRNQFVAHELQKHRIATLLLDLLTEAEEREEQFTGYLRFDIPLLAERLMAATQWVSEQPNLRELRLAFFGSSTGAAAALVTAANLGNKVRAVVSRGGRPDLATDLLPKVQAPTLLIVGGNDPGVLDLNKWARGQLRCENSLGIVPGATHLFEEPAALEKVAELAAEFLLKQFKG